jgi:hypothetical protein
MSTELSNKVDSCAKCVYWNAQENDNGECRRQPPQTISFRVDSEICFDNRFPVTASSAWCGEFKSV